MSATKLLRFGAAVLLLLALTACQGQQDGEEIEAPPEPPPEQNTAEQSAELPPSLEADENSRSNQGADHSMNESNPIEMSLEEAVDAARKDLAERSGAGADQISVADARRVTWANGALGCPEEGMMYTQALVEGYYVRLQSDGVEYDYHAGRDGKPFFCPPERSRRPPPSSGNPEM
ncbi:MAG: hypothetical protein GVY32_03315 [Gammaproteobacteria bacterium]|jgi:hypothetical protein|nr:hypothetical protein [Gammaproteobacteria bacterium]